MTSFSINERAVLAFAHDVIMVVISWVIAILLFSNAAPTAFDLAAFASLWPLVAVAVPVQAVVDRKSVGRERVSLVV